MEDDADLTDEEKHVLKKLLKRDNAQALLQAAQIVKDYESIGRVGTFLASLAKWILIITAFVVAARSGLLNFLGLDATK